MPDVESTLARIPLFAGRSLAGVIVQPLASLTNRTYGITLGGDRYVLRIPGTGTERYIDRKAELRNAALAASIGIAPEILYFDPEDGTMLTRFIVGSTAVDAARLREPDTLQAVAQALRRLHGSGLSFAGEMHLFPKVDEYMALLDGRIGKETGLTEARARMELLRSRFEHDASPFVPCHIDPSPANFLASGAAPSIHIIDWEYAALGEPAWDLAGLSIEAGFGAAEDRALLAAYDGRPTAPDVVRFRLHRVLLRIVAASWAAAHAADTPEPESLVAMARQRVAEFHAGMDALAAEAP
ncbi:MAG TPA: choline/ethanolamine kinase family protein [Methylomirabilota bacterium]|nr:choline/ethanolamine kinase family protein [Methylomirabilota bacterium]